MNIIAKILGSGKVISDGMGMIDDISFTAQEKAKHKIELLDKFQPYHLALRFLSLVIAIPYVFMAMVIILLTIFGVPTYKGFEMLNDLLTLPFTLVISFYFGNVVANGLGKAFNKKEKD